MTSEDLSFVTLREKEKGVFRVRRSCRRAMWPAAGGARDRRFGVETDEIRPFRHRNSDHYGSLAVRCAATSFAGRPQPMEILDRWPAAVWDGPLGTTGTFLDGQIRRVHRGELTTMLEPSGATGRSGL